MHEVSLVKNIFSLLEESFPGRQQDICGIHLSVGLLSNVQPLLMQSAFEAVVQEEQVFTNAALYTEVLPIKIHCEACASESTYQQFVFTCSRCGKPGKVVQGEEMLISKVEMKNPIQTETDEYTTQK